MRLRLLPAAILLASFAATLPSAAFAQAPRGAGQHQSGATQYREPNGRYTVMIPAGWRIDDSAGNLKITNGTAWANFNTTYGTGSALDISQKTASEMQPMVSDWKVYGQGPYQTASHHPAAGMTVGCTVPTQSGPSSRVMLFLSQAAGGGNYVTMTSSVDAATGKATNDILSQIFDSVRFQGEA